MKYLTSVLVGLAALGGTCVMGSVRGACQFGFPGLQLFSSDPEFIVGQPLYTFRGKGSQVSVGQVPYLLGYGGILPLNRALLGVPIRVPFTETLLRSVTFPSAPIAAQNTCFCSRCSWGVEVFVRVETVLLANRVRVEAVLLANWVRVKAVLLANRGSMACGLLSLSTRSLH